MKKVLSLLIVKKFTEKFSKFSHKKTLKLPVKHKVKMARSQVLRQNHSTVRVPKVANLEQESTE